MGQIIIVARGSADPAVGESVRSTAHRVSTAVGGGRVRSAFLRADVPLLTAALAKEAALAHHEVTVVPMLLTRGRHSRQVHDEIMASLRRGLPLRVHLADPLGPAAEPEQDRFAGALLTRAMLRRLAECSMRMDAVVVGAVGVGSARAMRSVANVASGLSAATGLPCRTGFIGGTVQGVGDAIRSLQDRGFRHVAVASYLLTPGIRAGHLRDEALRAGAVAVTGPLAHTPEFVELVLARAAAARPVVPPGARG